MSTMAKKTRVKTKKPNKKKKSFIRQVSKFNGDRLHIEVPKPKKDEFRPGDTVRVEKIE